MRGIRGMVVHGVLGAIGIVCGVLSVVALAVAAGIPAMLGMLAFALSPLRALGAKLRG